MRLDAAAILQTLEALVAIDSRNPALEEGAPGEWALARHLEARLTGLDGWVTALHDLGERRANVVAVRAGAGTGPSLMVNVHLDTVGVAGMRSPFTAERSGGRIRGRGAQDTKGGIAAALGMAQALAEEEVTLHGDLVLAFVSDEEHLSIGTADVLQRVRTDSAIVIEPSDLDICVAHRGFGIFRLRTRGRTAHGGRSDMGIDANLHMGRLLAELDRLRARWEANHRHQMLGSATLHVPLVRGGRGLFMYADQCVAELECRTVPGQSADDVLRELREVAEHLASRIDGFEASVEPVLWRSAYGIDEDRPIVRSVRAAAARVRGEEPRLIGHPWWEDSGLLGEAGIDAVILGPAGEGLHTEEEWVDADSVVRLAEILYHAAVDYCGRRPVSEGGQTPEAG